MGRGFSLYWQVCWPEEADLNKIPYHFPGVKGNDHNSSLYMSGGSGKGSPSPSIQRSTPGKWKPKFSSTVSRPLKSILSSHIWKPYIWAIDRTPPLEGYFFLFRAVKLSPACYCPGFVRILKGTVRLHPGDAAFFHRPCLSWNLWLWELGF